ncbi:hypothetical protein [Roseibium sp. RKSG952]|uniref:hypothetical protein n=1 Tax=Roseibium sp. RKSG952 TaxID=2529384 RepID=UPI0012BB9F75|nr:hypothetical protein [Roseibium sp. RKSG952]MTH96548.1 hypothetical protein [Roseibium sp. RKSG952]
MTSLKVLVGCEFSGVVRNAFLALGHDAWSCDLLPAEDGSNRHITGDLRDYLHEDWDLLAVFHPPCTRLCNSGVRWLHEPPKKRQPSYPAEYESWTREEKLEWLWQDLDRAAAFFSDCWNADIPHVAVENPVMHPHAMKRIRNYQKPSCIIHPWWFAHSDEDVNNEKKSTCFYLRNLPPLVKTGTMDGSTARSSVHKASPGAERWKFRSRFFPGPAQAIADQWGSYALNEMEIAA